MEELNKCDSGVYDDGNNFYPCQSPAKHWFIYPSGHPYGWCGGPGCEEPWAFDTWKDEITYEEAVVAYIMTQ